MRKLKTKEDLTEWALNAKRLWLFLDYDGTLDEFAPTPYDIRPNPEIIRVLEKLTSKPSVRVSVISGRSLEYVRQLVPISGIYLAGSYGIEVFTLEQETIHRLKFEAIRPLLESIKPQWAQLIRGRRGFFLEDKGWTLAIHARFADDQESVDVLQDAREANGLHTLLEDFRILGGHKFLEIAPRLANKGETVLHFLQTYPFEDARLIYIGDDDKDEEAFSVIQAHGGIAIKVVQPSQISQPTEADLCFATPQETLEWLDMLA